MYTFLIVLILIASVLMVLAVLVQNPKSGMASNFGASNQVMGVRQTADFLEKFTWGAAATVLVLSLLFTVFIGKSNNIRIPENIIQNVLFSTFHVLIRTYIIAVINSVSFSFHNKLLH